MVNIYQVTDTRWSNALTTYNAIWMDVNNGAGGAAVGASGSRLLKLTNNTTEVFGVNLTGEIFSPSIQINNSGQITVTAAGAYSFMGTLTVSGLGDTMLTRYTTAAIQHGAADTNTTTTALTSISNASPAVVTTASAHGLSVGTPVKFTTTGALPTGLTVGTQYYVSVVGSSTTYQVAASVGGASINTSGAGSGTHSQVVGPISQYIRMQGAITGTDLVGAPTYILGSAGTGAGAGGSIIFQVAPASGSSGTQNSYATALTISSDKSMTCTNFINSLSYVNCAFIAAGYDTGYLVLGAASDTRLFRDAADNFAQRRTTNAQNFRFYATYTDASNGAWAFINAAQTGGTEGGAVNTLTFGSIGNGTGAANLTKFKLLVDGTNRLDFNVTSVNRWTTGSSFRSQGSLYVDNYLILHASQHVWLSGTASGVLLLFDAVGTDFNRIQFGGTSTSYPALKRSGAGISFVLADGTLPTTFTPTITGVLQVSGSATSAFGGLQYVAATVASLPTAASAGAGAQFYVTDSSQNTYLATVSGGGTNALMIFSDGTQYKVG